MSKLLGSSPLGIAFFSGPTAGGGGARFIKPHLSFTESNIDSKAKLDSERNAPLSGTILVGPSPTTTAAPSSGNSTPTTQATTKKPQEESVKADGSKITMDFGLGYQTFGDKRTIFTDNENMPNTFYVYHDRKSTNFANNYRGGTVSLIDYFKSEIPEYYNSNYIDQFSSIPSIIKRLGGMIQKTYDGGTDSFKADSIQLKHADFAYLKKLGVYPSNRLIIARRFAIGAGDDLLMYRNSPLAVIPSWIEDGKSFIDISYGEVWQPVGNVNMAETGSDIAKEWKFDKGSVKQFLESGGGIFTLPGFTEYLQYYLFEKSGLTDRKSLALLPTGNPNIIRQAVTRPTFEENMSFTGLKYTFTIDITTEYEIKYIDGIDPTLVYFDIISNLLRFGTSESQFQFDSRFSEKAKKTLKDFSSGDFETTMKALGGVFGGLLSAADRLGKTVKDFVQGTLGIGDKSVERTELLIGAQIKKYRIKFLGIINALTGSPSGIYHITVGNPLRPIFSSGDLIPEQDMKITLGPELGYNNLPTTIKFSCKLKNARPCGLQEIYKKFSPASIRYIGKTDQIDPGTIKEESYRNIALSSQIRRPRTDNAFDITQVPSRNTNPQIVPNFTPSGPPPLSPRFPFVNP